MPSRVNQLEKLPRVTCLHLHVCLSPQGFPCQFLTYSISKEPKLLDSGTTMNFRVTGHLFPCEGSSFLRQLLTLMPIAQVYLTHCLHLHITALFLPTNPTLVQRQ